MKQHHSAFVTVSAVKIAARTYLLTYLLDDVNCKVATILLKLIINLSFIVRPIPRTEAYFQPKTWTLHFFSATVLRQDEHSLAPTTTAVDSMTVFDSVTDVRIYLLEVFLVFVTLIFFILLLCFRLS